MNLGQIIRQKRKEKGLTQTDVAKSIGVSTNTVSKYERNIIENMGRDKVVALSKLLDIPTVIFIEAIDFQQTIGQITLKQLHFEAIELINKTVGISDQGKRLLLQTLEFVCSDKE